MEKFKLILCVSCIYSLKLIYLIWNLHFNITALDKIESKQLPKNREKFVRLSHEYIYLFETRSTFKGERFVRVLRKPISMHIILMELELCASKWSLNTPKLWFLFNTKS